MYCTKCGAQIQEDSVFCKVCGAKVGESPGQSSYRESSYKQSENDIKYAAREKDYFVQNLLLTIFSAVLFLWWALPTSILALIFSCIVKSSQDKGDIEEAKKYSKLANIFMWISFGIAVACLITLIVAIVIGVTAFIGAGLYY